MSSPVTWTGYSYRQYPWSGILAGLNLDEVDRDLARQLMARPRRLEVSGLRRLDGLPYYVAMFRVNPAAVTEQGCLKCHLPSYAYRQALAAASSRSDTGDMVISVRIPLAAAFDRAAAIAWELALILLPTLFVLSALLYLAGGYIMVRPLRKLRDNVLDLAMDEKRIGREIAPVGSRELCEVTHAFNILSKKLGRHIDLLEERVAVRTKELEMFFRELRRSEQRYRLLVENAIEGICVIQDGRLRFHSRRFAEITRFTSAELTGMDFIAMVHPDDREAVRVSHERRLTGEDFSPRSTYRVLDGQGHLRWLEVHAVVVDWEGAPAILSFTYDITQRKQIEERLFVSEKMATIAGLAAGVAHEINTPLSVILQSCRVVLDALDTDSAENQVSARRCGVDLVKVKAYFHEQELDFFLDGIRESALKASATVNNLLEFSRPAPGGMEQAWLHELLDKSLELSRNDYQLRKEYDIMKVSVERAYARDLPPVMCDPVEIEQVFLNIFKNAVQAMAENPAPTGPRLFIRTARRDGMVRVEIEDTGPGIGRELRRKIFDPFFTTRAAGSGLGLSVCYAIVREKHKGAIWVESPEGRGAVFIVELSVDPGIA